MTRFSPTGFLVSSSLFITPVLSYEAYVIKVPNGANVDGVKAIGHTNSVGGGARNAFGTDFDDASHTWTTELCIEDSDGDGQTNGEELGDPCCEWTSESAKAALWSSGVSNPGDAASTSDETLWPTYNCSTSATNSSGNSTTNTKADSPSSTAKAVWSGPAVIILAGLLTLMAANVL